MVSDSVMYEIISYHFYVYMRSASNPCPIVDRLLQGEVHQLRGRQIETRSELSSLGAGCWDSGSADIYQPSNLHSIFPQFSSNFHVISMFIFLNWYPILRPFETVLENFLILILAERRNFHGCRPWPEDELASLPGRHRTHPEIQGLVGQIRGHAGWWFQSFSGQMTQCLDILMIYIYIYIHINMICWKWFLPYSCYISLANLEP